ncbi:MAG: hypothetical protein ACRETO_11095, partial [Gammaproteobacteria bacterium]
NTLSKMEKATPVNAEKALAEREAEFLKTAPVVKRAKSLGAPESAKSSTKSELKGKRSAQEDRAWKIAHEEALQDWQHRGEELIANVIQSSPARIAMAILLRFHQAWDAAISDWPDEKRIAAAVKKLKPFLTKLQKADGKSLIELAESLKPEPNNKVWPFDDWNGLGNPQMLEAVAAALNITLSKQPLEENFKQAAASGITKTTKRARAK